MYRNKPDQEIRVGSVVVLKSGGPLMTVGEIKSDDKKMETLCYWFTETKRESGFFPLDVLHLER